MSLDMRRFDSSRLAPDAGPRADGTREAPGKVGSGELKPGERGFTLFLLVFSCFALYQSILLHQEYPEPSSCAVLPLGVSVALTILSLWNVLLSWRRKAPQTGGKSAVRAGLSYALPADVAIMVGVVALYCAALRTGIGFYIATPLFLWGSMTYLLRRDWLRNLAWTALVMLFVWLVFTLLFGVVLP